MLTRVYVHSMISRVLYFPPSTCALLLRHHPTDRFCLLWEPHPTSTTPSCRLHLNHHFSVFHSFRWIPEQEINDMSNGCGENYAVIIVSEQFEGKMTLARHRLGRFLALVIS